MENTPTTTRLQQALIATQQPLPWLLPTVGRYQSQELGP